MKPLTEARRPGRIKAALLQWLGVPIQLTDGSFWSEFYGGTNAAGVTVNDQTVLKLSAVWACARLISESIATLPLNMYERVGNGKRIAQDHPLQFVLHDQPNPDSTSAMYWEAMVAAMLLRGNGRAERLTIGGRTVGLNFLDPNRLSLGRDSRGQRTYRYRELNGRQREIDPATVWNIPGFSTTGGEGISVLRYGAEVFGAAIASNEAASSMFQNALTTQHVYKIDRVLAPEQRKEFKKVARRFDRSLEDGGAPVLEAGMTVENIGINPDDAQLLESRGFSVEEICRWFRVPPFMVGHSEKSTSWGTGIEQQMIAFLIFTLAPWLRRIEQAISKDLLSPAERTRYYPKFAVEGLLRADSAARAAFYAVMVNNGILTRDEVRELEDREPMGGNAAVLTVQSAMVPLDALGDAPPADAQAARAALRAFLGVFDPEPVES